MQNDHQEFPKMLYFKGDATNQKIVNSAEEEDALGASWVDAPGVPSEDDKEASPGAMNGAATTSGYDATGTERESKKDKKDDAAPTTVTTGKKH